MKFRFTLVINETHPLAPTLLSNPFNCWWWCRFVECNWDCCCCWICCCCEWWWWWCWATLFDDEINEWFKFWFSWLWLWFDCWWKLSEFKACWLSDADEFVEVERFCDWSDESGWWDSESPVSDIDGIRSIIFVLKFPLAAENLVQSFGSSMMRLRN